MFRPVLKSLCLLAESARQCRQPDAPQTPQDACCEVMVQARKFAASLGVSNSRTSTCTYMVKERKVRAERNSNKLCQSESRRKVILLLLGDAAQRSRVLLSRMIRESMAQSGHELYPPEYLAPGKPCSTLELSCIAHAPCMPSHTGGVFFVAA